MNEEQKRLYNEWQNLESAIAIEAKIIKKGESYGPVKYIRMDDIEKIGPIRERVWDELKGILSIDEKFNLGIKLNKTIKEISNQEWPPKNWPHKKILAYGAIFRAKSSLHFLDRCLECIHLGGTDPIYSRSLYILLSHNVELILEARLLLASSQTEKKELIKEIKVSPNHNLKELSDKLLKDGLLESINIKDVKQKKNNELTEYIIEMADGKNVIIQDLTDVRYDFKFYQLRDSDLNEAKRMRNEVETLLSITKKIIEMIKICQT